MLPAVCGRVIEVVGRVVEGVGDGVVVDKRKGLVTHDLEGYEFEKTCNNDKNLSEIQLNHEKEDELVAVVVKVVHECDDFGVDVLSFHTCLIDILDFLEMLEWWFEQDINDEGEDNEEDEGCDEV
nr:hypothetical protein [Tanacetum cinerariifolium]